MHYCVFIFTKEFPTDGVIADVMAPFFDEQFDCEDYKHRNRPLIQCDWHTVGGRYNGVLKLECKENDEYYKWNFFVNEPRCGRLFRSEVLEDAIMTATHRWPAYAETEYLSSFGKRDGFIYVDGCRVCDLKNYDDLILNHGYGFIDSVHGICSARQYFVGDDIVPHSEYDQEIKEAFERNRDNYVTVLDIHD